MVSEKLEQITNDIRTWRDTYQSNLGDLSYRALGVHIQLLTYLQSEITALETENFNQKQEITSLEANIERLK